MREIQTCLDSGDDFPITLHSSKGIDSMAETLVRILEALPQPIIPPQFHSRCLDIGGDTINGRFRALEVTRSFINNP